MKTAHKLTALLVILIVAAVGTYLLVSSHAANPYTSTTASSGTFTGCAGTLSDSTASGGSKVVFGSGGGCGIAVGNPYIDPSQLDLLSPKTSLYYQPWRGYMDTVPATQFLDGIGVNYNPTHETPAQDNADLKYLASIGIHDIRIEVPWDSISPTNETQFTTGNTTKFDAIFAACKQYGITPTVLLNANDGGPEPQYQSYNATVVGIPKVGDSQITVSGIPASDIVVHQPGTATGASGVTLGGVGEAGNLITKMVTNSDGSLALTLSRPLVAVPTGTTVRIDYLKYLPLYPVGTPEFNNTMAGWMQYVKTATNTVEAAGVTNYSVEIWNELSFGSEFVTINAYYPPTAPEYTNNGNGGDAEHPNGNMWELANQTTQYLKSTYGSNVKVIWGFSNTSFYHEGSSDLPPNTDGETYHPYGTTLDTLAGTMGYGGSEYAEDVGDLVEGSYVPNINVAMPESYYALDYRIESLLRGKLTPNTREDQLPAGTTNFLHYITETGVNPDGDGVTNNDAEAQLIKAKSFLREYSFWLNKGLNQFDVFAAFDNTANDGGFNMLATGSDSTPSISPVTLQSQSLQNFTDQFAGAVTPSSPRNLGVTVTDITPNDNTAAYDVFPADPTTGEPALNYRQMFQFLPFQVTNSKFVIATYVMSWELTTPPPPMEFQVNVTNVNGMTATASYYDPITNTSEPITVVSRTSNALVLNIQAVDYPRLITINENGGAAPVISPPSSSASVPTGLSSPAQSRFSVALKWTASTDPSGTLAGYDIYRNGSIIATTSPTANSYSNCCSLTPSTSYTYSISAYDTANNSSAQSNSIKVSTLPDVPDTPQNLTASAVTSSSIKLTWTPKNDTLATIAGYDIYRNNVLVGTVSSGTSFTNTGLSANTSYQYYVEAYGTPSTNISAKSTVITVKTAP